MGKPVLNEVISTFFRLQPTKGIARIVKLITEGIQPDVGGMPVTPAKLIVEIPRMATDADVVNVLTEVAFLKSRAGKSIVTIVCVEDKYDFASLRLMILDKYEILE